MPSCPTCGDSFDSKRGRNTHHTLKHGESLLDEYVCEYCGDTFQRSEGSGSGDKNYCSWNCMSEDRKKQVEVECGVCGCDFTKPKHHFEKVEKHFCSVECYGKSMEENNVNWENSKKAEKIRREVYKRDNQLCQDCGNPDKKIHAHHIEGKAENPEKAFDKENLVTLCKDCHANRHEERGEESVARLLRAGTNSS